MSPPPTYGDYSHLFWDLDPTAPVNARHTVVFRRLLERGTTTDLQQLLDPRAALASLADIPLPDHLRQFWRTVFERAVASPR